jgi:hypothetical protein
MFGSQRSDIMSRDKKRIISDPGGIGEERETVC